MTEQEWLDCTDPTPMLEFLQGKGSDRKLRLLACACVSGLLPLAKIVPDDVREALEEVELFADGRSTKAAMRRVRKRMEVARASTPSHRTTADDFVCYAVEYAAQEKGCLKAVSYSARIWGWGCREYKPLPHVRLIRCVFDNPFRPVSVNTGWLTSTVVALAEGIYSDRAFDRMPILVDALQDARCDDADILNHCRSDGPHVRGCWVVDLILHFARFPHN